MADMSCSDSEEDLGFKINKSYAEKYNKWRQKEELQKLKDKYGDIGDESSSESEDDTAEALTEQVEQDWLRTLAALKSKNPKIYQKGTEFYHSESIDNVSLDKKNAKKRKEKPLFVSDYERKIAVEKGGLFNEDSDDERNKKPSYYEEQEEIKKSFKDTLEDSDNELTETPLFQKRKKTKEEETREEAEYIQWLKGQKSELAELKIGKDLEPLKNYWSDPKLDVGEQFLRDYILNKRYLEEDDDRIPTYEEIVDDGEGFSEEEDLLEKQEDFERKYNFRFEEPDPEFIKSFPRTIESSMRKKETKRAQKRQEVKERKKQEKEKKEEELKQLKNLKKQEIFDKIDQLKEISGNPSIELKTDYLEADFDPAEHDKMMQKYFNEDYYGDEVDEVKPEYMGDEEELQVDNWDSWQGPESGKYIQGEEEDMDNPNFNMDCDYDPSQVRSRSKKKKKSLFFEAVNRKKPVFNSGEGSFEEYLDEFYKLDYEDIIGDIPCRFKYRKVVPNDYGLTVNDILKCRDKELNAWASLKKMSQYRTEEEELHDVHVFKAKSKNDRKKRNILSSLYEKNEGGKKENLNSSTCTNNIGKNERKMKKRKHLPSETITHPLESDVLLCERMPVQSEDSETVSEDLKIINKHKTTAEKPIKRRKQSKTKIQGKLNSISAPLHSSAVTKNQDIPVKRQKNSNKRSKKKRKSQISDERLQAYGFNPKKFKYLNIRHKKI